MSKERLYLIDATAFCYRAYYAIKGLSTSFGQPTNAIFGFVNFLNKLLKEEKPEYLGICFDVSRDTFRQRKFAEYKIQRPQMPESLAEQIPLIKQIIQAYGITLYEKAGFEADDLIASLVKKAKLSGLDVVIVSSDKDVLQLVDEHVVVFSPYKNKGTVYDAEKIRDVFGINPPQIVDLISLAGDLADNIPQVRGIGEKTAIRLIRDFQSIDGILDNLDKIKPPRLQLAIKESVDKISLNRSIVKLREDVALEFDLNKLKLKEPDYSTLYDIFKKLEFKSLLTNLPHDNSRFEVIANRSEDISAFAQTKELVLYCGNGMVALLKKVKEESTIFVESELSDITVQMKKILSNAEIKKIGHNLKEIKVRLAKHGVKLEGLYFDTMIAAYLLNSSRTGFDLGDLTWDYLREIMGTHVQQYRACLLISRLKDILDKELHHKGLDILFFGLEMPLVDVLVSMELAGVGLDVEFLRALSLRLENQLADLIREIYKLSGGEFNINSPKQLRSILFERLGLPVVKRTKSGPSTDEEVLSRLADEHPLPKILLEYRKLNKIKSTYVDALPLLLDPQTKKIHASFNQTGTQTGRLSSSNPNLQNLPVRGDIGRQIRRAIVASSSDSFLVSFDYSQIELRILAHLSGDPQLIDAFQNNQDIHIATASLIYGLDQRDISEEMREAAKRINFGIIYGLSSFGLSRDLGISHEEAVSFIDAYFVRYSKVRDYIQRQIEQVRRDGYVVTILGRRRYIPDINSKNSGIRQFAERQAVNTPIQGSAADLIKKAMIEIYREIQKLRYNARLILQIHDELVFEASSTELDSLIKLVRQKMEGCISLRVPIKVVIKQGKNWLEMEEVE